MQPGLFDAVQETLQDRLSASLRRRLAAAPMAVEFNHTIRETRTPGGLSMLKVTASGRRTSDSGSTGWPTPDSSERGEIQDETRLMARVAAASLHGDGKRTLNLQDAAQLASWPTPDASSIGVTDSTWEERREIAAAKHGNNGFGLTLGQAATLAAWATPKARDERGVNTPEHLAKKRAAGHGCSELVDQTQLAGWATPTAQDHSRGGLDPRPTDTGVPLSQMAALASPWATPAARDSKGPPLKSYADRGGGKKGESLGNQVATSGAPTTSSPAATGSTDGPRRGVLNPAFSLWLMGFPPSWMECGISGLMSIRPRRRKSKGGSVC